MKNIKGKGNLFEGGGGGVKRGFTVFTFDVHFMNVFSLCYICLTQRSTLVTVAYFENQT